MKLKVSILLTLANMPTTTTPLTHILRTPSLGILFQWQFSSILELTQGTDQEY